MGDALVSTKTKSIAHRVRSYGGIRGAARDVGGAIAEAGYFNGSIAGLTTGAIIFSRLARNALSAYHCGHTPDWLNC